MKIVALRGHNLASLAQPFDINFEGGALAHAGVFAISGATGAGKTTLLDAICLALYHQTPRLAAGGTMLAIPDAAAEQTLGARDPRQLLRRGTAGGFAEVDFRGVDGQLWRARWEVKRAHGRREGRLQAAEASLIHLATGERLGRTITEVRSQIEARVGLGFAQFSRAVLLAQNEFAAFLRAAPNERAELLEALTGLERYSRLSMAAFERAAAGARQVELLRAGLDQARLLGPEERATRTARLAQLEQELSAQQDLLQTLREQQGWWQYAVAQADACAAARAHFARLTQAHADAAASRRERENWELGAAAAPLLAALDRAAAMCATLAQQHQAQTVASATAAAALARCSTLEQQAVQAHNAAQAAHREATPRIAAARQLDAEVAGHAAALQALAQALENASAALLQQQTELERLRACRARSVAARTALAQSLAPLQALTPLLPQWPALHLQLSTWQTQDVRAALLQKQLAALDAQIQSAAGRQHTLATAVAMQTAQLEHCALQLKDANMALTDADGAGLSAAESDWRTRAEALEQARSTLEERERADQECAICVAEASVLQQQLQQVATRLTQLESELPLRRELALSAQARHERARDAIDARTQLLRAQLLAGEPCPVCGATTHPWSAHGDGLPDLALEGLAAAASEAQTALQQTQAQHAAGHATRASLASQQQGLLLRLAQRETERDVAQQRWQDRLSTLPPEPTVTEPARLLLILASRLAAAQDQLQQWRARVDTAQARREQALRACAAAQQALAAPRQQLEDARAQQATLQAERAAVAAQQQTAIEAVSVAQAMLAADAAVWSLLASRTGAVPDAAVIGALDQQLRRLQQLLDDDRVLLQQLEETVRAQTQCERQLAEVLAPEQARLAQQTAALRNLHDTAVQRRRDVLDEASVDACAARLDQQLTETREAAVAAHDARLRAQQDCADCAAHAQALGQQALTADTAHAEAMAALDSWWRAQASGNASPPLAALQAWAQVDPQVLAERRQQLQELDTQVALAARQLAGLEAELARIEADPARPSQDATALAERMQQTEQRQAESREQRGALLQQLRDDDAQQQLHAARLAELAALESAERIWAQLNQLIGSKNGDKFRRIAQQHTLDLVLAYANQHLLDLAPRYRLQRLDFELLVIDADMGEEQRAVNSLSGGETFLLSLALALGLASLAAQRVRVESLFIDEGFGSLDQDTLRTAVDALDKLKAQGRQIGVISHVAELTERVAVRIRVRRLGHGRSSVEAPA